MRTHCGVIADFEPSAFERILPAPPLRATRNGVARLSKHGSAMLLDDNNMPVVIHSDEAVVTNHSTDLKLFLNTIH